MEYAIIFLPLLGSILGYLGRKLVKYFAEITTSLFVSVSAIFSIIIFWKGLQTGEYGNYKIFEWISSGNFIANLTNDVNMIVGLVSTAILNFFKDSLTLIGLLSVMFYQNWKLSLIAILIKSRFPISRIPPGVLEDISDHRPNLPEGSFWREAHIYWSTNWPSRNSFGYTTESAQKNMLKRL